jgi:lipopolysaccharide export system permease protein
MKIIDRLLIRSFLPPFAITFMIASFVLLVQILWVYIDDLAGKGLSFLLIAELMAYKCVSLVPMALPLALLISSVMVLGNLAEHYELSSLKSAGVSLFRVMGPMVAFGMVCTGISYYCSDYLIPVSNLKFGSRMYDIQRQKPALRLDEGVFNDDFQGVSIRIGDKKADGQRIENVLIYDNKSSEEGNYSQINARSGRMYTAGNQQFFVMELFDGRQYVEPRPSSSSTSADPFIRTSFKSWTRVFDLSEFNLQRTNEDLFKSNRSMQSIAQLQASIDSMAMQIEERKKSAAQQVTAYLALPPRDTTTANQDAVQKAPIRSGVDTARLQQSADASMEAGVTKAKPGAIRPLKAKDSTWREDSVTPANPVQTFKASLALLEEAPQPGPKQILNRPLTSFESLGQTFDTIERRPLYQSALGISRSLMGQTEANASILNRMKKNRVKFIYDLNMKYTFAAMCIVFLFIGAPMGAIVRKGGFGFPILISTIFFVLFVILTIFCRKIAEAFIVSGQLAAWIPCLLFIPMGLWLTVKAMNDSALLSFERFGNFLRRLRFKQQPDAHAS